MLALVALAALPVVNLAGPQDRTRFELTRHIALYQTLTIEPGFYDRAQVRLKEGALLDEVLNDVASPTAPENREAKD